MNGFLNLLLRPFGPLRLTNPESGIFCDFCRLFTPNRKLKIHYEGAGVGRFHAHCQRCDWFIDIPALSIRENARHNTRSCGATPLPNTRGWYLWAANWTRHFYGGVEYWMFAGRPKVYLLNQVNETDRMYDRNTRVKLAEAPDELLDQILDATARQLDRQST